MRGAEPGAPAAGVDRMVLHGGGAELELVRIPPGEFTMGSPPDEPGHASNEEPARRIRISSTFWLGTYPVTRGQYRAVMGERSGAAADDALPASAILYADALEFCRRLSAAVEAGIRLPTEAEWEYACRAGAATAYFSGPAEADLARVGWYLANAGGRAHPVGLKPANAWGLHDVHGNVWEMCADFVEDYAAMPDTDPVGHVSPRRGAMRGGGWMHGPAECRSASRMISDDMFGGAGFRVALVAASGRSV